MTITQSPVPMSIHSCNTCASEGTCQNFQMKNTLIFNEEYTSNSPFCNQNKPNNQYLHIYLYIFIKRLKLDSLKYLSY